MAKPTTTFVWASDELYTSGPFPGQKTKLIDSFGITEGAIPGEGIVAQFYNYNMAALGAWTGWLFDGTPDADLDAHIVETDATGESALASLVLGGTASVANPLTITDNTTTTALINATNTGTGFGILVTVAGDLAAIRATGQSSTGSVIEAQNLSGPGIGIKSQVSSGGTAIKAIATTGIGTEVTATSGYGVKVTTTSGTAGQFTSGSGYAVVVEGDVATPQRAGLRLVPQQGQPAVTSSGDIWYDGDNETLNYRESVYARSAWSTRSGYVDGFNSREIAFVLPGDTFPFTNVPVLTCSLLEPNEPRTSGGYVEIRYEVDVQGYDDFLPDDLWILSSSVVDTTAGGVVVSDFRTFASHSLTNVPMIQFSRSHTFRCQVPTSGPRQYTLRLTNSTPNDIWIIACRMTIKGIFDEILTP